MNPIRRHLSYANVAATLALLFAMSGGALAANHYLITSTKQISPKILKSLKGKTGATGKTGSTGAQGTAGSQGSPGTPGAPGAPGVNGANGTARAYAVVGENGILDAARSHNILSSKRESPGIYCITLGPGAGASSESTAPAATPDAHGAEGVFKEATHAYVETVPNTCKEGAIEVVLRQLTVTAGPVLNDTNVNSGFTLVVP